MLGKTVGNALELTEAIEYLQGNKADERLDTVTMALCKELLINSQIAKDDKESETKLRQSISTGAAYEHFCKMAAMLGADMDVLDNYEQKKPQAPYVEAIYPEISGYVTSINTREVGLGVIMLGGGRTRPEQQINYTTGFTEFCQIGDKVTPKTPLCYIHAEDKDAIKEVSDVIRKAIQISDKAPEKTPVILRKIA